MGKKQKKNVTEDQEEQMETTVDTTQEDEAGEADTTTNGHEENGEKTDAKLVKLTLTEEEKEKGSFKNFDLSKKTLKKLKARNVEYLFPVQAESYPFIYAKKDCTVQALTGTGKTLAFSIPIVELLQADKTVELTRGRPPRVLVLAPTRELTKQISDDFSSVSTDLSVVTIYGGKKYDTQEKGLSAGADIVVATPGRLKEFIDKGKLKLDNVQHVILDEVDRMLDMGFIDDVEEILGHVFTPGQEDKPQFIVFSATMPEWVKKTAKKYLSKDYSVIDLVSNNTQKTAANVEHLAVPLTFQDSSKIVDSLLQVYSSSNKDSRTIVFCQTKKEADELSVSHDIKTEAHVLHGDIPQDKRELVLQKFREGKYRLLVTTDVAARGLDIPEVDLVIVTAPPKDVESYIHRSGRTGRAGAVGRCICIFRANQKHDLKRVEKEAGIKFKHIDPPKSDEVTAASSADAAHALEAVTDEAKSVFRETAEKILEKWEPVDALSRALACITGTTSIVPRSLLTQKENYTTYLMSVTDEFKGVGLVFAILKKVFGEDFDAKSNCSQIAFTKDYKGAVFDLPTELDEQFNAGWKDSNRMQITAITELPELDESTRPSPGGGGGGYSRGGGNSRGGGGGGDRNSRGGGGGYQRNGGGSEKPSSGCFNCGKEGHRSFECPEPKKAYGGGRQSGGGASGACYNCGKEGHRSFDCPEPKKAGGGGGSSACFNCGKEGHRSFDCPEPKKAGSSSCFNCGKEGHMSRDCPEPQKARGSGGGDRGRGGRGGSRGGGPSRGGGMKRSFGGGEANGGESKKIKFDEEDDE